MIVPSEKLAAAVPSNSPSVANIVVFSKLPKLYPVVTGSPKDEEGKSICQHWIAADPSTIVLVVILNFGAGAAVFAPSRVALWPAKAWRTICDNFIMVKQRLQVGADFFSLNLAASLRIQFGTRLAVGRCDLDYTYVPSEMTASLKPQSSARLGL